MGHVLLSQIREETELSRNVNSEPSSAGGNATAKGGGMKSKGLGITLLALIFLALPFTYSSGAQLRFASPNAREGNHHKVGLLIGKYNEAAQKFNEQYGGKRAWEVKPEQSAEAVGRMIETLEEIRTLLNHYDEEDK